jgi:hypothetical protein
MYGAYILMWPLLTLAVLTVICAAVINDARRARKNNNKLL